MALVEKLEVVQIGPGLGAAVCTRLLADLGAHVSRIDQDSSSPLAAWLNHAKSAANTAEAERAALGTARLIVREESPKLPASSPYTLAALRRSNPNAVVVTISLDHYDIDQLRKYAQFILPDRYASKSV